MSYIISVKINIYCIAYPITAEHRLEFVTYLDDMSFHNPMADKCLKGNVYRQYDLSMHVFISSEGPSGSRTRMYLSDICGSREPRCVLFASISIQRVFFLPLFADNVCFYVGMMV